MNTASRYALASRFVVLLGLVVAATVDASDVVSVSITVSDLERARDFYSSVLDFEPVDETEVTGTDYEHAYGVFGLRLRSARMRLGDETIELMEFLAPRGRPIPVDSQSNDLWFQHIAIIVSDIDRAYARLREHRVEHASSGPQILPAWNPNAGGIAAFYFRDPDGNHLEILEFPADKGEPRWHVPTDELFLGIDHTAVVVGDTETSLEFYRDALGMRVAGHSENYGTEQEHLNNVFGARLRITALRADDGIGVELLEYLAPRTGRPMPVDTLSSDLWHWQINFADVPFDVLEGRLSSRYRYISSGVVSLEDPDNLRRERFLMVRDPDGHAISLKEPVFRH